MRRMALTGVFLAMALLSLAQDFTNKGKEFWIGYGYHVSMAAGNSQRMSLYITSDVNTSGVVEIPLLSWSTNFSVTANAVTIISIPQTAVLNDEGLFNAGIHVLADRGVVVYSHIYNSSVSGSTVCLPVATLGREYYSINYQQSSNEDKANSYFFVVASEDNTTVEIIPSGLTKSGHAANTPFNVTLNRGQVYQVMGALNPGASPYTGVDLTGSKIRSINTGTGCKKIAVFCGSGKIAIGCPAGTSDNLYQQMYPTSTWGKKFITVPSKVRSLNYYRIIRPDPSSVVKLNGNVINAALFTNGLYYEFSNSQTNVIESTQPIMVAQYFTSQQGCIEPNVPGDPEMIYLNPLEQTIDKATLYCSSNFNITSHYLNVSVRNIGTGVSSFKLDGVSQSAAFVTLPQDPTYSYAQFNVTAGTHNISSDSGFNSIVYGFGTAESYGYSAGTNLKDLYQFITINNQYATVNFPAGCRNSPLKFSMTFPYQPTKIQWMFGTALNTIGLADTTINAPMYDSTWVVNDRTLYRYRLDKYFMVNTAGTYPIKVVATNPTADGCSGEQEINYDLQVYDPPVAAFTPTTNGCINSPVVFQDMTNSAPRQVSRWYWNFGDNQTTATKNPSHLYASPGSFTIKFAVITDVGCLSDTVTGTINITDPPVAKFAVQGTTCEKKEVILQDQSTVPSGSLVKWYWDFGDNTTPLVATSNAAVKHVYAAAGNYTVTLKVETNTGCQSMVYSLPVVVHPQPLSSFSLPAVVCLPAGTAQFNDQSSISDGSQNQFTYAWDLGDGQTSAQKNPLHAFTSTGPFNIKLTVTSKDGCVDDSIRTLSAIYPQAKADFTIAAEACLNAASSFSDKSNGNGSAVTQWRWDFADASTATTQNPSHTYAAAGTYKVALFVITDKGCNSDTVTHDAIVHALPSAAFTASAITCETQQVTFTDASAANSGNLVKWNWDFTDGGTAIQQSPVHTFASAAVYNVSLVVESDKGCKSAATVKPVNVHYLPKPDFLSPDICLNDPVAQFFDNSTITDNSQSQFTYRWDFGDAATSTQKDGSHRYAAVGNYNVKLTVTSKDGCVKDITKPFTVNGSVPLSNFTVNTPTELCSNKAVSITDASTVDFGKIVKVEIYWDYTNDPTIKTTDATPAAGKTYSHKYPDAGTVSNKQIRYVVYSGLTCLNQFSRIITLKASPEIQFDPMTAVCQEIATFKETAAHEIYGLAGTGSYSGPGIDAAGNFTPAIAKPGTHTITYTFLADNGCTTEKTQTIVVYPTPFVDAGPDKYLLEGGYLILDPKVSGNNLSYLWTPATYLDDSKIAKPKVSATQDITYELTVTSADGCVASDDVLIKVLKEIKVPNAFSPNGDGINDTWEVKYLDSYPGCTVEVYNRYGQIVFRSVGYNKPWDGRMNGQPLPVGVYYWIINPKNGRQQVNGSVTIIR